MATWIAHLRLAENLLNEIDAFDPCPFAIGNLAPDSGQWNETTKSFEPSSDLTHYVINGAAQWPMADLNFYQQYLATDIVELEQAGRLSFLWGYFFHLITDNLWSAQIGQPTQARFPAEFARDPDFVWEVKRDWYGIDLHYVRTHPDAFFWQVFLQCEYDQDYLDFIPPDALRRRLAYIKTLYQRTDEEIEVKYGRRPHQYLTEAEMNAFIDGTTQQLIRIHQLLISNPNGPFKLSSALELLQ